jgi:hypothetical protein
VQRRIVRRLIALYPRAWQARYADEFAVLLEEHALTFGTVLNVAVWAVREHLLGVRRLSMDARQRAVILMACASLAALAAGVNFYWTVDGTPMAYAMRAHPALFLSFRLIARAALGAGLIVVTVGARIVITIVRSAFATRRWGAVIPLALPMTAGIVTIAWIAASMLLTGARWVPTPWDVTGNWTAPAAWPALPTRWAFGAVTFALLVGGVVVAGASVAQTIRRTDLSKHSRTWLMATTVAFTVATLSMTAGAVMWGWFAEQYAGADFHAIDGGLFNSSNFASWLLSTIAFVAATTMSIHGTRSALLSE